MNNLRFLKAIDDTSYTNNTLRLVARWYGSTEIDILNFDDELLHVLEFSAVPSSLDVAACVEKYFMDEFDKRRMRKMRMA